MSKAKVLNLLVLCLVCTPVVASAKTDTLGASCSLSVASVNRGSVDIEGVKNEVVIRPEEWVRISWYGDNALSAKNGVGKSLPVIGNATVTPTLPKQTYIYKFKGDDSTSATCAVTVYRADASFDYYSLTSIKSQPTLTGSAMGLKNVVVVIKKNVFSEQEVYHSKLIPVTNGRWKLNVPIPLQSGTYSVDLRAPETMGFNYMVTGTLTVSAGGIPSVSYAGEGLPVTKTVSGGESVEVAHVRLTNTSKGIATISGLMLRRTGTVGDNAIIGLGVRNDKGGIAGFSGGVEGYTPFNAYHGATVPFGLTLAPGETSLLTVSASVSKNAAPYGGKTFGIDVYGVVTAARVVGQNIVGTLFTLR